jgi:hypothetical protein
MVRDYETLLEHHESNTTRPSFVRAAMIMTMSRRLAGV